MCGRKVIVIAIINNIIFYFFGHDTKNYRPENKQTKIASIQDDLETLIKKICAYI